MNIFTLNSALYLTAVFVAGIVTQSPWAWRGAIVAMGTTYLCYVVQFVWPSQPKISGSLVALSIVIGAAAGLVLL